MSKERNPYDPPKPRIRFGRILFYIFSTALILLLVAILFNVIITRKRGEPPSVFGYSIFIVTTSSMEPAMPPGAAILVKKVDPDTLEVGDVITFQEGYDPDGKLIVNTHRIVTIEDLGEQRSFRTKGDNNNVEDDRIRYEEDILGEAIVTMPTVGKFFAFIKTPVGLVTCIAVPLVILLIFEIFNLIRLSRKPKDDPFPEEEDPHFKELAPAAANARKKRALFEEEEEEEAGLPPEPAADMPPAPIAAEESGRPAFPQYQAPALEQAPPEPPQPARPPRVAVPATAPAAVRPVWQPNRAPIQPPRADVQGLSVESAEAPAVPPTGRSLYHLNVPTEREEVPLEQVTETIGGLSYIKPVSVRDDASELYATQEFRLRGSAPPNTNHGDRAPVATAPPRSSFTPESITSGENETLFSSEELTSDFAASMASKGRDRFKIEGIDVKVKPDAIKLALAEDLKERDISITVTKDYTNVTVGTAENEVNFALFRDDGDDGQKVIIQKKNK